MDNPSDDNTTLFNLSFEKLCENMNHDTVQIILKFYPPSLIFKIMNKFFHVKTQREDVVFNEYVDPVEASGFKQGRKLFHMAANVAEYNHMPGFDISDTMIEDFANTQQTLFDDKFDFCSHFDLDLFFKLVNVTEYRMQLYTFFQICVQKQGLTFPGQLAKQWIEIQTRKIDINLYNIECGLKLGIFLGDTGWFIESALVLAYTYDMITTKWECFDQNLKQIKMIQCLAKWLLVVSNYYNYQEAKFVLPLTLEMIDTFEKMEEKNVCIVYAYIAVSQFHHTFMDYNEAWTWAVKAVNELHDKCSNAFKLSVISQLIKASTDVNKFPIAKELIENMYSYDKEIGQTVCVDALLNVSYYSWKIDLTKHSISNYYFAIDLKRNLFGYYNLFTAIIFVDYAYARYIGNCSSINNTEALWCVLQGIFIMKKIGLPNDNMLFLNALKIKSLLLLNKGYNFFAKNHITYNTIRDECNLPFLRVIEMNMKTSEQILLRSIKIYQKEFGENNMFIAKSYDHLSDIYRRQTRFMDAEVLISKALDIKTLILDPNDPELAVSYIKLCNVFMRQLKRFIYVEHLYLQAKSIYELNFGSEYSGLKHVFKGLAKLYYKRNVLRYRECTNNAEHIKQIKKESIVPLIILRKYPKPNICLEELKTILNNNN